MYDNTLFKNYIGDLSSYKSLFSSVVTTLEIDRDTEPKNIGKFNEVTEKDKLFIAGCVLLGLGIIFVLGILVSWLSHQESIFDGCKTVIPPIATLILGYYFSRK